MTERLITWASSEVGRRSILRGAMAIVFSGLATVAVGKRVPVAHALGCCIGPFGTGYCGANLCNGHSCWGNGSTISCTSWIGQCGPTACWTSSYCSGSCCDCVCYDDWGSFYCYCADGGY